MSPTVRYLHENCHLRLLHGLQSCVYQLGGTLYAVTTCFGEGFQVLALILLLIRDPLQHDFPPLFQNGTHAVKLLAQGLLLSFAVVLPDPNPKNAHIFICLKIVLFPTRKG